MKASELRKEKTFRNYTPHTVNMYVGKGIVRTFFPVKGANVRVREYVIEKDQVGEFDYVKKEYCGIEGLPAPEWGIILIVSVIVLQANKDREDLVCPDTGPDSVVRDDTGNILGVKRFQR